MTRRGKRRARAARIALAALAACATRGARADDWSAVVEPRFQWTKQRDVDQAGRATTSDILDLGQRYGLTISKSLFPTLSLNLGGTYDGDRTWTTVLGEQTVNDTWRANGFGRLLLGGRVLGGSAGYERTDEVLAGQSGAGARLVNETARATAYWRPGDLPQVDLIVSRTSTFDTARHVEDLATDDVLVSADYQGISKLKLRYTLRYSNPVDRLNEVDTTSVTQSLQAIWEDRLFGGRTNAFATATVGSLVTSTSASGTGGTVSTQQFPVAGYSLVEGPLDAPERDTLALNPGLVNGDLVTGVGLDIGYGVPAGDVAYRDVGAQFQDVKTRVNLLYVWVNKPLPPSVSGAYAWRALQSDDNLTWTEVAVSGPVVFSSFQSRFEIPIVETSARYLKLVVRPLAVGVTLDPRYASILVTELQTFLALPASEVVGRTSYLTETFAGTAQTRLLPVPSLSWDVSALVNRSAQSDLTTYNLVNGLSLAQRLSAVWNVTARAQRQDQDSGAGHVGGFQWGGTLSAKPLSTLTGSLTYSGLWNETPRGTNLLNSVAVLGRAEVYRGTSFAATGGLSDGVRDDGQRTRSITSTANASMTPHPKLTFTANHFYASTSLSGGRAPAVTTVDERVDAGVSLTPFPALYLNGTVNRIIRGVRPTTFANGLVAFSPFQDGALQLRFSYGEAIDTSAGTDTRTTVAGVHWMIRPGVLFDTSYTVLDSKEPASSHRTGAWFSVLTITI